MGAIKKHARGERRGWNTMSHLTRKMQFACVLALAFLLPTFACSYWQNRRAKAIAHGYDLFVMHCSGCHSRRRLDLGKVPPDLRGVFDHRSLPSGRSATDDMVRSTILTGRSGIMPAFEGSLSDADIEDIILYLHTLKAPPASGADAQVPVVSARQLATNSLLASRKGPRCHSRPTSSPRSGEERSPRTEAEPRGRKDS